MKLLRNIFIALSVLAAGVSQSYAQRVFTENQSERIACAKERLYAIYTFLDASKPSDQKKYEPASCGTGAKGVNMPKYLEKILPEMDMRRLWQVSGEGSGTEFYSEAEIWRQPIGLVFNFLELMEQINSGSAYTTTETVERITRFKTQMMVYIDRLKSRPSNYELRTSMEGRGRSIIATLDLIDSEMGSVLESFKVSPRLWRSKFRKAVMGITTLSNSLYGDIVTVNPRLMPLELSMEDNKKSSADIYRAQRDRKLKADNSLMITVFMLIGTLAVFISGYMLISDKNDQLTKAIGQYMQKSSVWADDFSRQFLDINVKYIVLGTLLLFCVIGAIFGAGAGGFMGVLLFAVFFAMGLTFGLKMPGIVLNILKKRRGEKINAQLMDALILLSNSLKSGMDIVQGFDMVSRDLRPPISDEFSLVIKNYKLGSPFEKALEGMEDRVDSRLLSYMVKAIVLQRQVGGNLTKIFERIVENIREESKLEEKLQAMTAQQRIQAIVVGVMPWVMVGVMFVFQPDIMVSFYTSTVGIIVLAFCIFWIGVGIKLVNKLGEIKV